LGGGKHGGTLDAVSVNLADCDKSAIHELGDDAVHLETAHGGTVDDALDGCAPVDLGEDFPFRWAEAQLILPVADTDVPLEGGDDTVAGDGAGNLAPLVLAAGALDEERIDLDMDEGLAEFGLLAVVELELAGIESEEVPDFFFELEVQNLANGGFLNVVALHEDLAEALVGLDRALESENLGEDAALEDAALDEELAETAAAVESTGVDDAPRGDHQGDLVPLGVANRQEAGALAHADELEHFGELDLFEITLHLRFGSVCGGRNPVRLPLWGRGGATLP